MSEWFKVPLSKSGLALASVGSNPTLSATTQYGGLKMNNQKKCFVIMPFSTTKSCTEEKWTEIFEFIIKPAVQESGLGYECERSVAERENIIKGILEALNKANVVIADLTGNNPNVFYEPGVRHTLANRTILIAQGEEHIPFDLRPYPVAFYSESPAKIAKFKKDIKKKLEDIEKNPDRSDSPVADFLKERNVVLLSSEKKRNLAALTALISELSYNIDAVDSILVAVKQSGELRAKEKGVFVSHVRFDNTCLELLLSTSYITLTSRLRKIFWEANDRIRVHNCRLDLWPGERFSENVEEILQEGLPKFKGHLISLLKEMSKFRTDYANDNYQEPKTPAMILISPEHKKYIEITK